MQSKQSLKSKVKKMLLLTAVAILFVTAADGQGLATREQTILNVFGRLNLADNPFDNLNYWTDGSVFFRPFFFDVCSFGVEPRADNDTIFLCGGSLHEGGWGYEILLAADGKMTIATDDFRFKKGDRMEYRIIGGDTLLLFSDVGTGAVKDMFKKFDGNLYQRYIDNFYQYIFDGKFKHMEGSGDAVVFTRDKSAVSGLLSKNETSFTFIEKFGDTPVPALRFGKDVAYKVTKMLIGIELSSLLPEEEEWEWVMEADNSKPAIMLVKTDEGQADLPPGRFPLVSGQAMTLTELDIYAGEPKLSNLKVMRNEIFARYGYKFKTRDMADFFGTQDWYFPTHDDVASGLTEIERINIALIQALEKQYNN
jgi:hypothetical protein